MLSSHQSYFVAGDKPWQFDKVKLGSWSRGESYMEDILEVRCIKLSLGLAAVSISCYMSEYINHPYPTIFTFRCGK